MGNEIFNSDLLKYAQVFKTMAAPLGDHAPRCRLLSVDYKNKADVDCYQDIAVGQNPDMTDGRLVELVRQQYTGMGFTVSAITEIVMVDDVAATNSLYIKPGFLEETMMENGLPVPHDMAGALAYAGISPVNLLELVGGADGR